MSKLVAQNLVIGFYECSRDQTIGAVFSSLVLLLSLGELSIESLLALLELSLGLETHDTTSPLSLSLRVLLLEVVGKGGELVLVLLVHIGQSNNSGVLLVHESTETALGLDDAERNVHLSAESWQPEHQLDRVHVVSNHNQASLLLLHQVGDVLETVLEHWTRLGRSGVLASSLGGSELLEALVLGLRSLRSVLGQQLQQLAGLVLVQSLGELVDAWRNLQSLVQDLQRRRSRNHERH